MGYKNKLLLVLVMACSLGLLTACSTTENRNGMIEKIVTSHKLANGKTLKIGYKAPLNSWKCHYQNEQSYNWSMEKMEGMAGFAGGYSKLKDRAVKYANAHKSKNINYVFLNIPNQTSVDGFNVTFMRKAHITYYNCKKPPATNHNPF